MGALVLSSAEMANVAVHAYADGVRISHVDLARSLDYARSNDLLVIIERQKAHLVALANLPFETVKSSGRGRPGKVYFLNRDQVLWLCSKSEQPLAVAVTVQMIAVFSASLSSAQLAGLPSADDRARDLDLRSRELNMRVFELAANAPGLADTSRQMLLLKAVQMVSGMDVTALLPPAPHHDWLTPTQIASDLGVTPNKIGRTITELGLRGDIAGMARPIVNKAVGHTREVVSYVYSPKAVERIRIALEGLL